MVKCFIFQEAKKERHITLRQKWVKMSKQKKLVYIKEAMESEKIYEVSIFEFE